MPKWVLRDLPSLFSQCAINGAGLLWFTFTAFTALGALRFNAFLLEAGLDTVHD